MSALSFPHRHEHARVERHVEVRLRDVDAAHHFISTRSETLNVSEHGLLMEVPAVLDACEGQEVIASLHWDGGDWESPALIVRFESPYWRDPSKSVMGVRLARAVPAGLLTPVGAPTR